jgi:hypothetical protein
MNLNTIVKNGIKIAVVTGEELLITDAQSALDLLVTVRYETDCDRIALEKGTVSPAFFVLSSGLAGDVLQKFSNYQMKLAIFGDYTSYTSKPLRDFIRESNRGNHIFFTAAEEEAVEKLSRA